jgi:hypothetical protein
MSITDPDDSRTNAIYIQILPVMYSRIILTNWITPPLLRLGMLYRKTKIIQSTGYTSDH